MRTFTLLIVLGLLPTAALANKQDMALCQEYLNLSHRLNPRSGSGCGPDNYLSGYGYRYCREFVQGAEDFSPRGKIVLRNIRSCLVSKLLAKEESLTCDSVEDYAYSTHAGCYVRAGFCSLSHEDRALVYAFLSEQIFNPRAWEEFFKIASQCWE